MCTLISSIVSTTRKGVSGGGEGHEVGTHVTRSTKTFAWERTLATDSSLLFGWPPLWEVGFSTKKAYTEGVHVSFFLPHSFQCAAAATSTAVPSNQGS